MKHHMHNRIARSSVAVVAALVLLLSLGAASALAHVNYVSGSPAKNGSAKKTIKSASVTFSGQIKSGTLTIKTAAGAKVSVGAGARDPRNVKRVLVSLKSGLKAGKYTATWTLVAGDGHKESGSYSFTLKN